MGATPLALVAESHRNRVYLPFEGDQQQIALQETQQYLDSFNLAEKVPLEPARGTFASNAQGRIYGFKTFADYFASRQLVALTTFSDLVSEAKCKAYEDAIAAGLADDGIPLSDGGEGSRQPWLRDTRVR